MAIAIYLCTPRDNEIIVVNKSEHNITARYASVAEEYIRDVIVGDFIIIDTEGKEIPYIITADKLVVFPVTVDADSRICYTLKRGAPSVILKIGQNHDIINLDTDKTLAITVI